jgi:hypothetical protein
MSTSDRTIGDYRNRAEGNGDEPRPRGIAGQRRRGKICGRLAGRGRDDAEVAGAGVVDEGEDDVVADARDVAPEPGLERIGDRAAAVGVGLELAGRAVDDLVAAAIGAPPGLARALTDRFRDDPDFDAWASGTWGDRAATGKRWIL